MNRVSRFPTNPMLWEEDLLPAEPAAPQVARERVPSPGTRSQHEAAADPDWHSWWTRLQGELAMAAICYALAYLLFGLHRLPGATETGIPAPAAALFLLGTGMLWRVTRTLHDPVAAQQAQVPRRVGRCVALAMTLAFSPAIWWLLCRA